MGDELEAGLELAARIIGSAGILSGCILWARLEWSRARWLVMLVSLFCGAGLVAIWVR